MELSAATGAVSRNDCQPPGEEQNTADRSNGAEPTGVCNAHDIQCAAEKQGAGENQAPSPWTRRRVQRQDEQDHGVAQVVERGGLPVGGLLMLIED